MKEEWQANFDVGVEPLPELPPPEFEDDMARTKKPTASVQGVFTAYLDDGRQIGPLIVSEPLPTSDYDISKAFAFLAARAAEMARSKTKHQRHD